MTLWGLRGFVFNVAKLTPWRNACCNQLARPYLNRANVNFLGTAFAKSSAGSPVATPSGVMTSSCPMTALYRCNRSLKGTYFHVLFVAVHKPVLRAYYQSPREKRLTSGSWRHDNTGSLLRGRCNAPFRCDKGARVLKAILFSIAAGVHGGGLRHRWGERKHGWAVRRDSGKLLRTLISHRRF